MAWRFPEEPWQYRVLEAQLRRYAAAATHGCGDLIAVTVTVNGHKQRSSGRTNAITLCEGRDSNPHRLPRQILSLVRLPIPPPSRALGREHVSRPGASLQARRSIRIRHVQQLELAALLVQEVDRTSRFQA